MAIEDKTLLCFCHWGGMNRVLPDGSISYGGGITDQDIAKTGIKYYYFVNAVFHRLGIDPSDKMLHFTVKFDRSELIRLRDQEGVDTLLQFNDGYGHLYASSLEKELYSRSPPGGTQPLIPCDLGSQGAAHRPKQSQPGGQDMPLKSNLNKPFEQRELPNRGTSEMTAVGTGFPPTQTGSRQDPEIYATNFICDAQFSNLDHHKCTQPTSSAMQETFWTKCPSCKLRYQYYSIYMNCTLRCQKCSKTFTAYSLGSQGAPRGPKWSQPGGQDVALKSNLNQPSKKKELPNQGTSKLTAGSTGFPPTQRGYQPGLNSRTAGFEPEKCRGKTAPVFVDIWTKRKDKLTIKMTVKAAMPKWSAKAGKGFGSR